MLCLTVVDNLNFNSQQSLSKKLLGIEEEKFIFLCYRKITFSGHSSSSRPSPRFLSTAFTSLSSRPWTMLQCKHGKQQQQRGSGSDKTLSRPWRKNVTDSYYCAIESGFFSSSDQKRGFLAWRRRRFHTDPG